MESRIVSRCLLMIPSCLHLFQMKRMVELFVNITEVENWSHKWWILFNVSNYKVTHLDKQYITYTYKMGLDINLDETSVEKVSRSICRRLKLQLSHPTKYNEGQWIAVIK